MVLNWNLRVINWHGFLWLGSSFDEEASALFFSMKALWKSAKKNWQFPWFEEQNSIWQKKIQFCQLNFEVICLKKLWGAAKWFYGLLCFVFCFFFVKFARVFRVSVQIHLCSQTFVLAWRSAFYRPAASLSCCCCYFVAVHLCKILFATKSTACTANTLPEPLTIWLSTL